MAVLRWCVRCRRDIKWLGTISSAFQDKSCTQCSKGGEALFVSPPLKQLGKDKSAAVKGFISFHRLLEEKERALCISDSSEVMHG